MNSIIGWVGGKKRLRNHIIEMFPSDHKMYVEVFGGAGWVLLGKSKHAPQEVYNDINGNLVNLFRCVKYHSDALTKELALTISARELFECYKQTLDISGLTDIQKAARFFYLVRLSFGSKYQSYATRGKSINSAVEQFKSLSHRLDRVVIENKNYEDLIKLYDRSHTLFYLDPPYYGTESYYNKGAFFSHEDHLRLKNLLDNIKGRFVLSYNDDNFIKELYADYDIENVTRKELLSSGDNSQNYKELIIKNFK